MVEYAIGVGFIAAVLVVAVAAFGTKLRLRSARPARISTPCSDEDADGHPS